MAYYHVNKDEKYSASYLLAIAIVFRKFSISHSKEINSGMGHLSHLHLLWDKMFCPTLTFLVVVPVYAILKIDALRQIRVPNNGSPTQRR